MLRHHHSNDACGAVAPSCHALSCSFSHREVQEPQFFWKRHRPRPEYPNLFSPPLRQGPNGYTNHSGRYEFALTPLHSRGGSSSKRVGSSSNQSLSRWIDLLFHLPAEAPSCPPSSLCRLGNSGDGGWVACRPPAIAHIGVLPPSLLSSSSIRSGARDESSSSTSSSTSSPPPPPPPCTVLSFGIKDDASFDAAAAFAWGCTVHMFDHTIPPPAQRILANLHKVSVSVTATCNPL